MAAGSRGTRAAVRWALLWITVLTVPAVSGGAPPSEPGPTMTPGESGAEAPEATAPPDATPPAHLADRGAGVPISERGTYVGAGQWLFEVAFESVHNKDFEYDPPAFGIVSPNESDYGPYVGSESRALAAYGLSDRFAVELEARGISASLDSAPDAEGHVLEFRESGLGRVSGRINWSWTAERGRRPELFSYVEAVAPHDAAKPLTGTTDWIFDAGLGAVRGFHWGTMTARAGFEYDSGSESQVDFHEYAVEYLRRLSPDWRLYLGYVVFEGDEANLVTEVQWTATRRLTLRLGHRLGIVSQALSTTSNSVDWAPSIGLMLSSPER